MLARYCVYRLVARTLGLGLDVADTDMGLGMDMGLGVTDMDPVITMGLGVTDIIPDVIGITRGAMDTTPGAPIMGMTIQAITITMVISATASPVATTLTAGN